MHATDILADGFERVRGSVHGATSGLDAEALAFRPEGQGNSIGWLVWHLTRIQDDHVADLAQAEQRWTAGGWVQRFALPFAPSATGYGQGDDDVAAVRVPHASLLLGYHDEVHQATVAFLGTITDPDLDRVIDTSWDPPVTMGVRLVSVIADDLEHAGQAAYLRGLRSRARAAR